jgi:hypothetical protein
MCLIRLDQLQLRRNKEKERYRKIEIGRRDGYDLSLAAKVYLIGFLRCADLSFGTIICIRQKLCDSLLFLGFPKAPLCKLEYLS